MAESKLVCPVQRTVAMIADKYKIIILHALAERERRFGELQRSLDGITPKVLTRQLRDLERDGLITRRVFAEVPPRVEYRLSPLGESLGPVVSAVFAWADEHAAALPGELAATA